jgi:opine dehydrogenase
VDLLNKAFNDLTPAKNVFETSINNNNPIGHVPLMILNAGWIEATEGGFASSEGRTTAVRKLEKALDGEKMEVANALGFEKISNEEWTARFYRKVVEETGGQIEQPKYYSKESPSPGAMAPSSLKHRYLVEDIMYAYVPMASIGKTLGVKTRTMDSVIDIASIINEVNYWEEGANSEKLGIKDLNVREINRFVS